MDRPRLHDWTFRAPLPVRGEAGWTFAVEGQERRVYGPFAEVGEAWSERERLFRRWCAHARARGGWAWRPTAVQWAVTLPEGAGAAGLPLEHRPCTWHVG